MSDYIKREDAIKSIKPMVGIWDDERFYVDYQRVLDIINNELSANVVEVSKILKTADEQEKQGFIQTAKVLRELVSND